MKSIATASLLLTLAVGSPAVAADPVPLDSLLTYKISYLGVPCGELTLRSEVVDDQPSLTRIVMTVKSNETFDKIYKVRSQIESLYNTRIGSSRRARRRGKIDRSNDGLGGEVLHP